MTNLIREINEIFYCAVCAELSSEDAYVPNYVVVYSICVEFQLNSVVYELLFPTSRYKYVYSENNVTHFNIKIIIV